MDLDLQTCLEHLQSDVEKVTNDNARTCLSNFIQICSALYATEEEDEKASQTVVGMCREQILKTHQKSTKALKNLLNSDIPDKQSTVDSVICKLNEINNISGTIDKVFGKAPPCSQDGDIPLAENPKLFAPMVKPNKKAVQDTNVSESHIKKAVAGLNGLADVSQSLQRKEDKVRATNRYLTQRLERLRVEAGTHPAIEVYTTRNCRSSMAVRKRQEEYTQYAVSMERVLKKVNKATEEIWASTQKDVTSILGNLPVLSTLSHTLGNLHTATIDAVASPDETEKSPEQAPEFRANRAPRSKAPQTFSEKTIKESEKDSTANHGSTYKFAHRRTNKVTDTLNNKENGEKTILQSSKENRGCKNTQCSKTPWESPQRSSKGSSEELLAQKLTQALAYIGCMRRQVDAALGQVGLAMTNSPGGDRGDYVMGDGVPFSNSEKFNFIPLGDKESQEQLIEGTKLLTCGINDLLRVIQAKSRMINTQALLDKTLCRPFPKTAILRLDLIRLLVEQNKSLVDSKPFDKRSNNTLVNKSKVPPKAEKSKTMRKKKTELKNAVKEPSQIPKNSCQINAQDVKS